MPRPAPGRPVPAARQGSSALAVEVLSICASAALVASGDRSTSSSRSTRACSAARCRSRRSPSSACSARTRCSCAASPVDWLACDCFSYTLSSEVVFGIANLASAVWLVVSVKYLIHSAPSPAFCAFCRTARSEPPRNDGVYLPAARTRERERRQLGGQRRVAGLRVGHRADLPAVAEDRRDVPLRHDRVLGRLVQGRAADRVVGGELLPFGQTLLRLRALDRSPCPLAVLLLGDLAAGAVDERHRGVPVLARHVERREARVAGVGRLDLVQVGVELVERRRRGGDAGLVPQVLAVDDDAAAGVVRHRHQLAVGRGAGRGQRV